MPIELKYNKQLKYILITVKGNATVDEAERTIKKIADSDVMSSNENALWDTRELLFDHIDIDFIKNFIKTQKQHNALRSGAKIAVLTNSMLAAPLIKLYTILSRDLNQSTNVFKTIEEAELWLCEDLLKGSDHI